MFGYKANSFTHCRQKDRQTDRDSIHEKGIPQQRPQTFSYLLTTEKGIEAHDQFATANTRRILQTDGINLFPVILQGRSMPHYTVIRKPHTF